MIHKAKDGFIWQNKKTKMKMGEEINIGFIYPKGVKTQDTIDNYEEVPKPQDYDLRHSERPFRLNIPKISK